MKTIVTDDKKYDKLTTCLDSIKEFIETDLQAKQVQIMRLQNAVDSLKKQVEEFHLKVEVKERQLQHTIQLNEGNKQLINKLLGNISKLQNDIEWYKRTYEKRSFAGILKEGFRKLFR